MYRTFLENVWLSDIGRMAEVRNVPHVARNVWLRGNDTYYIYGIYYENKLPTHTRTACDTLHYLWTETYSPKPKFHSCD